MKKHTLPIKPSPARISPRSSSLSRCVGRHLLLEFWGASRLDDLAAAECALRNAVRECGATLIKLVLHRFRPAGVSGAAVLAESHICLHTWPEEGYAALDIFMCGQADPNRAVPALRRVFRPRRVQITERERGIPVPVVSARAASRRKL